MNVPVIPLRRRTDRSGRRMRKGMYILPSLFTTSERLGRAMLRVVQGHADKFVLEVSDINRVGQ